MPMLASLADFRDAFIIVYSVIGIVFFFIAILATIFLFLTARGLIKSVKSLVNDSVRPTINSVKDAADTVKGTTDYVGKTAVSPIMRTYGAVAGLRKGLSVLSGMKKKSDD